MILINGVLFQLYVFYFYYDICFVQYDICFVYYDICFVYFYIFFVYFGCYVVYFGWSFFVDCCLLSFVLENEYIKFKLGLRFFLNIKKLCKRSLQYVGWLNCCKLKVKFVLGYGLVIYIVQLQFVLVFVVLGNQEDFYFFFV